MSAACRALLREAFGGSRTPALAEHLGQCAFCRARLAAGDRLAQAARERPRMPAPERFAAALEGVYERVVAACEVSSLGISLAAAPKAPAPAELPTIDSELVRRTMTAPPMPAIADWTRVRAGILERSGNRDRADAVRPDVGREVQGSAHDARPSRRAARVALGVVGSVAAATLVLAILVERDRHPAKPVPEIQFADLDAMPAVDFAVLRHGLER